MLRITPKGLFWPQEKGSEHGPEEQHSPKEVCLVSRAIQGGRQQQLRVLSLLGPECPQAHGSHHKEHGQDDLGDEAAHIAPRVVGPLDEQG